jgi:hypothetical protein
MPSDTLSIPPAQKTKLKDLLAIWPENAIFIATELKRLGYSSELIFKYTKSKWLKQIAPRVYARFQDSPSWQAIVCALQTQMNSKIYIGGKTALEIHGFIQYVPMNYRTIHLYSPINHYFPKWLLIENTTDARIIHYSSNIFGKVELLGLTEKEESNFKIKISTPERAILEMLHHIPSNQSFIESAEIMEFLVGLRPVLLNELLNVCQSIKVRRLFLFLADLNQHPWFKEINFDLNLGKGKRVVEKNGVFNKKYLITVPKELTQKEEDYE